MNLFHHRVVIEVPLKYQGAPAYHKLIRDWSKRGRVTSVQADRTYTTEHGVMVRDQVLVVALRHNDDAGGTAFAAAHTLAQALFDEGEYTVTIHNNGVAMSYTKEDMLL